MRQLVSEVFDQIKSIEDKKEKVSLLEKFSKDKIINTYIRLAYDKNVKSLVPEGVPEIPRLRNIPTGLGETTLNNEARRMYIFFTVGEKPKTEVPQPRREALFCELYKALDDGERKYLLDIKDKKLDLGIPSKDLKKLFPGLKTRNKKTISNKEKSKKE